MYHYVITQLNDHLKKIQQSITSLNLDDAQSQQLLADLNMAITVKENDGLNEANEIRQMLFTLRRRLNSFNFSSTQLESCKRNVHNALFFLAKSYPLNEKNYFGKPICPLSDKPIHSKDIIMFSNGYYYSKKAIDVARNNKTYFPALPNISQYDADAIHQSTKRGIIGVGIYFSLAVTSLLLIADMFLTTFAPFSLVGLAMKGLGLLGVSGLAAVGITGVGLIIIIAALTAIGIGIAISIYDKQNGSKLAPEPSTSNLLVEMPRDESKAEHKVDKSQALLNAPGVTEADKIIKLDEIQQPDESKSNDVNLDVASGVSLKPGL